MAINVTHLRSFWHVARARSYSEAARRLGVSQPTLTRQVARLEKDYGKTLLERSTRRIRLTDDGWRLLSICDPIFQGLNEAEDLLKSPNELTFKIHSVNYQRLPELLTACYQWFPKVRFEVTMLGSPQIQETILGQQCDFGMLTLDNPPAEIEFFKVGTGRIIAFVPPDHPWRDRKRISIRELEGCSIIVASRTGQSRRRFDWNLETHGISVNIAQVVDSHMVMADLVRRGVGIGVTAYTGLEDGLIGPHLEFEEPTTAIDVHFASHRKTLTSVVHQRLFDMARASLQME